MSKVKTLIVLVCLAFVGLLLTGCGGKEGGGVSYTGSAYKVWSGTLEAKMKAQGGEEKELIVLPQGVTPEGNYTPEAGATVTFVKDDGSTVEMTTDSNGVFDLGRSDDAEIKNIVNDAVSDASRQPDILVVSEDGTKSTTATIAIAVDDKESQGVTLRVIPDKFKVPVNGKIALHAIRENPEGKVIKAKDVTWTADEGTITPLEDTSIAIYTATATGGVTIKATIQSGSASAEPVVAYAYGEVFGANEIVTVRGTVYKDTEGGTVFPNCIVNFALPPVPGGEPFHYVAKADENGVYTVRVHKAAPGSPDDDDDGKGEVRYTVAIGDPVARKLVEAQVEEQYSVLDNRKICLVEDVNLPEDTSDTDGVALVATTTDYRPPAPPPIERLIKDAFFQVKHAIHRHWWEPGTGIGKVVCFAANANAGAEGTFDNTYGMFSNWKYKIAEKTGQDNWAIKLVNPFGFEKQVITYDGAKFAYKKAVLPKPDPSLVTAQIEEYVLIEDGEVTAGVDFPRCTFAEGANTIEVNSNHYFVGMPDENLDGTPDKVAMKVKFTWTRQSYGSDLKTEVYDPRGNLVEVSNIKREMGGDPPKITSSSIGEIKRTVYLPDGTTREHTSSFETTLPFDFATWSGAFKLTDTTSGDVHNGAYVEITTQMPPEPSSGEKPLVATGKVVDENGDTVATFRIYMGGFVEVYKCKEVLPVEGTPPEGAFQM